VTPRKKWLTNFRVRWCICVLLLAELLTAKHGVAAAKRGPPQRLRLIIPIHIYDWHKSIPSPFSVSARVAFIHLSDASQLNRRSLPFLGGAAEIMRRTASAWHRGNAAEIRSLLLKKIPLKDVRFFLKYGDKRFCTPGQYTIRAIVLAGRWAAEIIWVHPVGKATPGVFTEAYFARNAKGKWRFSLHNPYSLSCVCNAISSSIILPSAFPSLPAAARSMQRFLIYGSPGHSAVYIYFHGARVNYLVPPVPTQKHTLIPKQAADALRFLGHAYRLLQQQRWTQYTQCFGPETRKHLVFGTNPSPKQLTPKLIRFLSRMIPVPVRYVIYGRGLYFFYSPAWVSKGIFRFKDTAGQFNSPICQIVQRMADGKMLIVGRGYAGSFQQMENSPRFYLPLVRGFLNWGGERFKALEKQAARSVDVGGRHQ
jgi:hypothetical protein